MNLKGKLISTLALLGVISCTSVYATEVTSVFSGETVSRENIQNISLTSELTTDTILGISKTRENGNWYVWNPAADAIDDNTGELIVDEDGNVQAKKVWKIAKYSSEISNVRDYSNLYYCLNAERGFGLTDVEMAEGKKDIYSDSYDMKDSAKKSQITTLAGGNLGTNYNKILWILENSYIPTSYEDYQSTSEYKKLMNAANISIDSEDERLNLTEDDIEVVQQMAIWYFTNSENNVYHNSNLPSLYLDGKQLTSLYFETDEYGSQITGAHRQNKAELLYKYYIESATSSFSPVIPTLTLSNSEVKVKESGNNYVVGPFLLTGTNTDLIKEISTEVNVNYTLLDSSKNVVANNDFSKVIGNNGFYLQISKENITQDTQIKIDLTYKYDTRELTLLTNKDEATSTQPVVLVKNGEIDPKISTTASIELVTVSGTKTWIDYDNQDNTRPNSITVNLLANGKEIKEATVTASNNWAYQFNNLIKYDENNNEIEYTVTEDAVEEYTTTIDGYNITNVYTTTTSVNGRKTWVDYNNQDNTRPESITVNLLADGTKVQDAVVAAEDDWSYSFKNLPKYNENNELITYTVTEDPVEKYTTTINGYNITNVYTTTTSVNGTKTWIDENNQDKERPDNITVNLLANGTEVQDVVVTAENNWSYSFTDLPKYDENNKLIEYTISEDSVEQYQTTISGYDITNTYVPKKVNKTVIKVWEDGNDADEIRPKEITVKLYKLENGQEVDIDTQVLSSSNNWTYTWSELDQKSNGEDIVYEIKEIDTVQGYTTTYDYSNTDTITITNTHISKDLAIQLQKVDEQGVIITSSEAEFDITGSQELKEETDKGILNLDSQKLVGNNFEFVYTIKENKTPMGYNGISEELSVKIAGTTKTENSSYVIDTINITDENGNELDNEKVLAEYDAELNKVVIKIVNTKIENGYSVRLLKVGEDGETTLEGAWFKVNDGQAILVSKDGKEIASGTLNNENDLELTYNLEETQAPNGYIKINDKKEVKIKAKVELVDNEYQIKEVELQEELENITISEEDNVITIKVENQPIITGEYNVVLKKVDENGNILTGSKFEINDKEYNLSTGEVILLENIELLSTDDIILNYNIKETTAPEGYVGIADTTINVQAKVQKEFNEYKLIRAVLLDNEGNIITNKNISVSIVSNSIIITVKNNSVEKKFDLALRKFITKINNIEYSRGPVVDTSTITTTGTATYKHTKQPIAVQKGDIVTYTIRVYNEGELDGYVDKITDYLPHHLLPIIEGVEGIDSEKYSEEINFNLDWGWIISEDGKSVTTMKTSKANSDTYPLTEGYEDITDTKLDAYVEGSNKLDYIDVQIKCLVSDSAVRGEYLTNIAEITDAQDINEKHWDGTDSELTNANTDDLSNYKNSEATASTEQSYIPGQEDDDDFEKLVVKEFDLSLRKFITKVNDVMHARAPIVDTSKLGTTVDGKDITTATYTHSKEPVIVETNDIVTYTIRIFNEGTIAGFANEITDDIPEGLEFLPDSEINKLYGWRMLDSEGNETENVTKAVMIITDYLSDKYENNIINAVSEVDGVKTLDYKDVEVEFKVIAKAEKLQDNIIINEAQISADSDRDIDSEPNRDEKYDYTNKNNEDDIDYEPIKLQYFDLALRKFITKVNSTDYNNRYPEIKYNEDGSITYVHTKDPVLVTTGDIVTYTIRVYNEGEKAGYATEIKDNLPNGLAFDPENETNKLYGWKMLDSEGNETTDASKVVSFSTDYLKDELISAIVEENNSKVLSYQDVKIAFVVTEPNTSDRILVNTAQISADSDDDIDSTPDNNVESEDDLDKEYVRVEYFDLALKKWVTATKVTLDGKTTTTKTGFTEDSEGIAKVDIVASKLKKTTVKFVYNIKVTNEGELPGYAYEVKDYIPSGLKFVAEDNKDWKQEKDGVVVTDKLKDTLLNPGESATVEIVLKWKNSSTNLGLKTNYAEISEDSADDVDSTPDNYDFTEDDIDDAQVILSIKTAGATTYVGLILISVAILAGGVFLIKKYVID